MPEQSNVRSARMEHAFRTQAGVLRVFFESHTLDRDAADEMVSRTFEALAACEELPDDVAAWIRSRARGVLGAFFRGDAADVVVGGTYGVTPPPTSHPRWIEPEPDVPSDLHDDVADAIASLPDRQKLVIALHHYENLTEREIGEVLGVSEERIQGIHARALRALSASLDVREHAGHPQPTVIAANGNPLDPDSDEHRRLELSIAEISEDLISRLVSNPELVYQLAPRRFEELVAELYARRGFEATLTPASGDGGVDIWVARSDELGSSLTAVQCKRHAASNKVGVALVRELTGTLQDSGASSAVLLTTSFFTQGGSSLGGAPQVSCGPPRLFRTARAASAAAGRAGSECVHSGSRRRGARAVPSSLVNRSTIVTV
jgi:RNA polymerase sigma factor (sigma-70 family)